LSYQIHKLFPTYLHHIEDIPISDELLEHCLTKPDFDNNIKSNRGGKQSITTNEDSIIKDLIQKIIDENIQKVFKPELEIQGYWVNVNSRDNYNIYHCHPGAALAGVVYLQASEDSGDLVFYHPNAYSVYEESTAYTQDWNLTQHVQIQMHPKTGSCYIFPGHVMHGVEPNRTQDDRVSVSFNLIVRSSQ
tara:strand:- start:43 stop:612 length:570 start_codon:yes stop_codon:yes gene_type:complete